MVKKVFKKVGPVWWKKYSKNFKGKDLKGYYISEKYEGEWKNGEKFGKGILTIYLDPAYGTKKDWTPKITEQYKGKFVNNMLDGEIQVFDEFDKWTRKKYKLGKLIN